MNKIKVLLIEDDRSISNFITATMDREGYKIMHALNGREGLSLSTSFCRTWTGWRYYRNSVPGAMFR